MFLLYEDLRRRGIPHSERQLRRLEAEAKFPRRVHLSAQKVAWDAAEIEQWCEQRRAAREPAACWVCGMPAVRVMDGVQCCAVHTHLTQHPDGAPPEACAVPACGAPSDRTEYGFALCAGHGPADLPPRSF